MGDARSPLSSRKRSSINWLRNERGPNTMFGGLAWKVGNEPTLPPSRMSAKWFEEHELGTPRISWRGDYPLLKLCMERARLALHCRRGCARIAAYHMTISRPNAAQPRSSSSGESLLSPAAGAQYVLYAMLCTARTSRYGSE